MSNGRKALSQTTQVAQRLALKRLDEHPAWPVTPYQLECEKADIYQNTSGRALELLKKDGKIDRVDIQINGSSRPYLTRPGQPSPEQEIVDAHKEFDNFLGQSGYFANLIAYVAFCRLCEELSPHITGFDTYPEGPHPYLLNNSNRDPDGVILLPDEHVPVEVYNGGDYLGTGTRKYSQLIDLSTDPDHSVPTNPILLNRRSDDQIKEIVRSDMNGLVIDTDHILACETNRPYIQDALDTLNLSSLITFIPEVETADGLVLDGADYDGLSMSNQDVGKVHPPSKLSGAAENIPESYMQRVRGGVQLQYVNSIYREGHDKTKQIACLVLQEIYNLLLREGGHDRSTALDIGWQETLNHYTRLKSAQQRKSGILDETRGLLDRLQNEHIVTMRNGEIHARRAEHPQQHLEF
jgi:hypothetical protein